jgi:hypothetical protein
MVPLIFVAHSGQIESKRALQFGKLTRDGYPKLSLQPSENLV